MNDGIYNGSNCKAVACGYEHTAILTTHGTVLTFGNNYYGQLGDGTTSFKNRPVTVQSDEDSTYNGSNCQAIACGYEHTAILTISGEVLTFGNNSSGQLGMVLQGNQTNLPVMVLSDEDSTYNGSNCQAIACGHYHTAILTISGEVLTF